MQNATFNTTKHRPQGTVPTSESTPKDKQHARRVKAQIRQLYDEQAAYWRDLYTADEAELTIYAAHFRQRREAVLEMVDALGLGAGSPALGLRPGARVLDAGCGPGAFIQPLLERGFEVVALDQSEGMVASARDNFDPAFADRAEVKVGNAESLPVPDQSVDVALSIAVLQYVPDDLMAIGELYRVLKPGATLVVVVDNKKDLADQLDLPLRARRLWRRVTKRRSSANQKRCGAPTQADESGLPRRTYAPEELRRALSNAGLIIDEATVGFAPFRLNGKRLLSEDADKRLDKMLQFFRKVPFLRLGGYMYICRCHRPEPGFGKVHMSGE